MCKNTVSRTKKRTWTKALENCNEKHISTWGVGEDDRRLKKYFIEFHSLYSSANIIMVTRSFRIRWAEHVDRMGDF
jgi:hypothetical protein